MEEIVQIRQDIKSSTSGYLKENIPSHVLNTYANSSMYSAYAKDKEMITKRSAYTISMLKQEFSKNALQSKHESSEMDTNKTIFKRELEILEGDLNGVLQQLGDFNRQRLKDHKAVAKTHNEDLTQLKSFYDSKLQIMREESKRSRDTIKELIKNREGELAKTNKEIEGVSLTQTSIKTEIQNQIEEFNEAIKLNQEKLKTSADHYERMSKKNFKLKREK